MTTFQIIMIILGVLTFIVTISGLYVKTIIQLAKVETEISNIKKQLDENREDHIKISDKLDQILNM